MPLSRTKIKICGVTTLDDARFCRDMGVDFVGLNIWEGTPRRIAPSVLDQIILDFQAPDAPQIVIVDVSPDRRKIETLAHNLSPDFFQIHGDWDGGPTAGGLPVIRAFQIGSEEDVVALDKWEANPILLDSRREGMHGGTGLRIDIELIAGVSRMYFLAGGLSPVNVRQVVDKLNPFAVDVASGVETSPGIKSRESIKAFVAAVRGL